MSTVHPEYLLFRDTSGMTRKMETDPLTAVPLVQRQDVLKDTIQALGITPQTPVLALIFGGKYERPRKESPLPGVPAAPTDGDAG